MREETKRALASMTDQEWDELIELVADKVREALLAAIVVNRVAA